jgi:hypothetical protein
VNFVATFEDGPKNGPKPRTFKAPSVPERMWFAPERRIVDRKSFTHDGWMLVRTAPGAEPAEPWPGELEFVLDPERSDIELGAPVKEWGTVVYVYKGASETS